MFHKSTGDNMTTKTKTALAIGTLVKVSETYALDRLKGKTGKVVAYTFEHGSDIPLVDFGAGFRGHRGEVWALQSGAHPSTDTAWFLPDNHLTAVAKEPTAPMSKAVLDLMRRKGAVTCLEAQGVLRCRSLPRRILDLKNLGHKIVTEMKLDPTGQKYARYHLQAA
jgi:hypothetical protein